MGEAVWVQNASTRKHRHAPKSTEIKYTYKEDILELLHVVDAAGVELSLHLVGDLIHSVFPVCHLDWLKVCFVVLDSVCLCFN